MNASGSLIIKRLTLFVQIEPGGNSGTKDKHCQSKYSNRNLGVNIMNDASDIRVSLDVYGYNTAPGRLHVPRGGQGGRAVATSGGDGYPATSASIAAEAVLSDRPRSRCLPRARRRLDDGTDRHSMT